jgi:hypothetical protein
VEPDPERPAWLDTNLLGHERHPGVPARAGRAAPRGYRGGNHENRRQGARQQSGRIQKRDFFLSVMRDDGTSGSNRLAALSLLG